MATFLPFIDVACVPLNDYPNLARWYHGLCALPHWLDPFRRLDASQLPLAAPRPG